MIDRFEKFSFSIFSIHRFWHKIAADEMMKFGIKGPHVVYLVALKRFENGITAAALAEICGRDKSDVSRAIASMEEKGFVIKVGENNNLYRAKLKLTEEGKKAAQLISQRASLAVEKGGKGLTDVDRVKFYETLETIAANLQTISEDGLPK